MFTKLDFAVGLKNRALERQELKKIGEWAYAVYLDWPDVKDTLFLNLLLHLNTMELGPEFSFSYEELD